MTDVITNYYGNQLLLMTLATTGGYLSLHNGDPGVTGDPTTEVGGITRQSITFNAPSGKAIVSNNKQTFTGIPAGVVTHLAVWDTPVGGHVLCTKILPSPITTTALGHFLAAAGDFALQL